MTGDDIARIRHLEGLVNRLRLALERLALRVGKQEESGGGGRGGTASSVDLLVARTPVGGIPHATFTPAVAGTPGTPWRLTPGSAACAIGERDGTDFIDSGIVATVFNDFTSTSSTDIAGNTMVPIGRDALSRLRVNGEPC